MHELFELNPKPIISEVRDLSVTPPWKEILRISILALNVFLPLLQKALISLICQSLYLLHPMLASVGDNWFTITVFINHIESKF